MKKAQVQVVQLNLSLDLNLFHRILTGRKTVFCAVENVIQKNDQPGQWFSHPQDSSLTKVICIQGF